MKQRPLGRTGVTVSEIGLGTRASSSKNVKIAPPNAKKSFIG